MPPVSIVLVVVFLLFSIGIAFIASSDGWSDKSNWSRLACIKSHEEFYSYKDDRPHKQGGRGDTIYGSRMICDERATIGPVYPVKRWGKHDG